MEAQRFPGAEHATALRDYLLKKYVGKRVDAIVAAPDSALAFLLRFRGELFPGVPIVALVTERPATALGPGVTTLWGGPMLSQTADLILRARPDTRRLILIDGALENSGAIEREVRNQLGGDPRLTLEYLRDRPLEEVLQRVRAANPDTAVFYLRQFIGEAGQTVDSREALIRIVNASTVPVFGTTVPQIGMGIVGGYILDTRTAGATLTRLALRIADGETLESSMTLVPVPMVNWRELARWGISESRLPVGSVVHFRAATFWQQYRHYVVGAAALLTAQTCLIAALLIHRVRRRRAEAALQASEATLRASYEDARRLAGRLISAQEAERKRIARDLHDDLSQKLVLLTIGLDRLTSRLPAGASGLSDARDLFDKANDIAGYLHRLSHQLHPSTVEVLGLVASVRAVCAEVTNQAGVAVEFRHRHVASAIPPDVAICFYRIVQEALHNVVKHSGARAASVRLSETADCLHLHIADRGRGFDPAALPGPGLGLVSIRERVNLLGGRVAIRSSPARGTRIAVHAPIVSTVEDEADHTSMSA